MTPMAALRLAGRWLTYLVGFALFSLELFDVISMVAPANIDFGDVVRYGRVAFLIMIWVVWAGMKLRSSAD